MDFDRAVARLNRDHTALQRSKIRSQSKKGIVLSARQKRDLDAARRRAEEKRRLDRLEKRKSKRFSDEFARWEAPLGAIPSSASLCRPASIHGEGDRITLPPSVLERLSQREDFGTRPLAFRVGIPNPDYCFPGSSALRKRMEDWAPPAEDDEEDEHMMDSDDEGDLDAVFVSELSARYLSYTHAAVVEFTQEEGCVGLPLLVAKRLLSPPDVPRGRTSDPSGSKAEESSDVGNRTPGHVAWGAFDVPSVDIEVTLLSLPKGKGCTLTPTDEAYRNGFGNLKDVKAVLEQSLIRTRATLTVGDMMRCWNRGVAFDLEVSSVSPDVFRAVSCIDTDIEVDIGTLMAKDAGGSENASVEPIGGGGRSLKDALPLTQTTKNVSTGAVSGPSRTLKDASQEINTMKEASSKSIGGSGRTLKSSAASQSSSERQIIIPTPIPKEPPLSSPNTVTISIRGHNVSVPPRRFDVSTANKQHLLLFVKSELGILNQPFRLVTRYPRRIFTFSDEDCHICLKDLGVDPGREMFMVEFV